jgi:8-oxo-dGTP pyrophosphatase MutT (NUDIX family)
MSERPVDAASPPLGLAFDAARPVAAPRDAATVLLVREGSVGLEVFCVERNVRSGFLGGAVVFPGGKIDASDRDVGARNRPDRVELVASSDDDARALAVGACRELLEEAGVLASGVSSDVAHGIRSAMAQGTSFAVALEEARLALELDRLVAFARWITPEAEARRFDARFFVMALPEGQHAEHDGHETTRSFWSRPTEVLARFAAGAIQLAPPTTRCLELLSGARDIDHALSIARAQRLEPVCPRFVAADPPFLALPGDPEHSVAERIVAGPTRFVLREGRFVSEEAP